MKGPLKGVLVALAVLLSFPVSCAGVMIVVHETVAKQKVEGPPPDHFPVLVRVPAADDKPARAWILLYRDLEKLSKENPYYSFLIPAGEESRLQDWVASQPLYDEKPDPGHWGSFRVRRLSDGRQAIEVSLTIYADETFESWYEATDREIEPHYVRAQGGVFAITGMLAVPLTLAAYVVGLILYGIVRFVRSRRRQNQTP